jgi:hypothetical protein
MALLQSMGRECVVGIATRYVLDGPGIECRGGGGGERFSVPVQTAPGAHTASYTRGAGSFPRVKWPGGGVDHPSHLASMFKKEYRYTSIAPLGLYGLL